MRRRVCRPATQGGLHADENVVDRPFRPGIRQEHIAIGVGQYLHPRLERLVRRHEILIHQMGSRLPNVQAEQPSPAYKTAGRRAGSSRMLSSSLSVTTVSGNGQRMFEGLILPHPRSQTHAEEHDPRLRQSLHGRQWHTPGTCRHQDRHRRLQVTVER